MCAPYAGITTGVIHLSDTAAAVVGLIGGPVIALVGALVSNAWWDRWYGGSGRQGRIYTPVLWRFPRAAARACFIFVGVAMTLGGVLLIALGRA
jgi:hypothetical protein